MSGVWRLAIKETVVSCVGTPAAGFHQQHATTLLQCWMTAQTITCLKHKPAHTSIKRQDTRRCLPWPTCKLWQSTPICAAHVSIDIVVGFCCSLPEHVGPAGQQHAAHHGPPHNALRQPPCCFWSRHGRGAVKQVGCHGLTHVQEGPGKRHLQLLLLLHDLDGQHTHRGPLAWRVSSGCCVSQVNTVSWKFVVEIVGIDQLLSTGGTPPPFRGAQANTFTT